MQSVFELSTWFAGCWGTAENPHRQSSSCSHITSPVGSTPRPGGKPPFLPKPVVTATPSLSAVFLAHSDIWQGTLPLENALHSAQRQCRAPIREPDPVPCLRAGCHLPGEDTTVHHRPASPGDGDVSMELTDVYATEMAPAQPAAEPQLAAEVQPPLADEAVLDVQAPAAAEADGSPATEAEQAAEAEAAPLAASPEPLLQFGDAAADAAQQAAAPADLLGSPLAAAAAPAEAVAAPPSVSQLQQEDEQLHAPAEPELQHAPAEPELQPQQLDMGDLAAAPAPADSQLAAGSPPPALHMGVPQILDSPQRPALSGSLQQEGFSQRLQDSPAGSSELPERLSLSPAQREQRSKWGCVPGADYTVDLDVAANGEAPKLIYREALIGLNL